MKDLGRGTDAALIAAARGGDQDAFGELYRRHSPAANRLARSLAGNRADADDLVAEAFIRLLETIRAGTGPAEAFRPYLLTTLRNVFLDGTRRGRREVTGVVDDQGLPFVDTAVERLEHTMIARAFEHLPERWQVVLWHTAVEGEKPAAVAPLLGLTPNAVAALAHRAREALRQRYLQEHVSTRTDGECQWSAERLGAHLRGGLRRGERSRLKAHLAECGPCHFLWVELAEVNSRLGGALASGVVGVAVAYAVSGAATVAPPLGEVVLRVVRWLLHRPEAQATAGTAAAAAVVTAIVVAIVPGSIDDQPSAFPPPASHPATRASAVPEGPTPGPSLDPSPGPSNDPSPGPSGTAGSLSGPPVQLDVSLEPLGSLLRGRGGVLALTVNNPSASLVGPIDAQVTLPPGVTLAGGPAGGGWTCSLELVCRLTSLAAGATSTALVNVDVGAGAGAGEIRADLTGPTISAVGATSPDRVTSDGLAAALAFTAPSTVVVAGNSLVSCGLLDLWCALARTGVGGLLDNDDFSMKSYVDPAALLGAPSGLAVSGARVTLPGRVRFAGLYWAGTNPAPAAPIAYVRSPTGSYVPVGAQRLDTSTNAYQAFADVTDLVDAGGSGVWSVAADAGQARRDSFSGWALVVIADDGGPLRKIELLDGLTALSGTQSFTTRVQGNAGPTTFGFIGWEGDRGDAGAQLSFGSTSTAADSFADGTPPGWNTFGVDARVLDGEFNGEIIASTTGDDWLLGVVAVVSPA